jgi:hypothetical protein
MTAPNPYQAPDKPTQFTLRRMLLWVEFISAFLAVALDLARRSNGFTGLSDLVAVPGEIILLSGSIIAGVEAFRCMVAGRRGR